MDTVSDPRLDDAIRAAATGERKGKPAMTCAQALELAKIWNMDPEHLGEACDRLGIKIMACQLGCFT